MIAVSTARANVCPISGDPIAQAFLNKANPNNKFNYLRGKWLVIRYSDGGNPDLFKAAAMALKQRQLFALLDGYVASSAILFADKARPRVYVTERTEFAFHKGRTYAEGNLLCINGKTQPKEGAAPTVYFVPQYSQDIIDWVNNTNYSFPTFGGFPIHGRDAIEKNLWPRYPYPLP